MRIFAATKDCMSCEGTFSSKLVIEGISNPDRYCSSASPRVHFSGSHWTKKSSTHVERRIKRMRLGSHRPKMWCMARLSPGTSLPLRGSDVVATFSSKTALCLATSVLPFARKLSIMRGPSCAVACGRGWVPFNKVPSMDNCRDVLSTIRGEGLFGRDPSLVS